MTEASIGSGLSTLIFLYALRTDCRSGELTHGGDDLAASWSSPVQYSSSRPGLGMLRMPDAYTRMQAGTKASTLGNMLVVGGYCLFSSRTGRLKLVARHLFRADDQPASPRTRWRVPLIRFGSR